MEAAAVHTYLKRLSIKSQNSWTGFVVAPDVPLDYDYDYAEPQTRGN